MAGIRLFFMQLKRLCTQSHDKKTDAFDKHAYVKKLLNPFDRQKINSLIFRE